MHSATSFRYRADIDGLRAIAVLAVVLFHARLGPFSGGFVGVDIFFVISGYLITSIIVHEREQGSFSLPRFYERRVRRILPALLFMLTGATALAYATLLPTEMTAFARSALATALFSVNFYFWRSTGYFAPDADHNALLHMWSLSVEEQFYLLYPFLLILLLKPGNRKVAVWGLAIMALASLAAAEWMIEGRPKAVFYLLPTRAWELLLGAVIAVGLLRPWGRGTSAACAAIGLAMIGWAVLSYAPGVKFPGLSAFLPCAGTALLIHAGSSGGSFVTRCLSTRPIVLIGQISYSLYLWHWPLLVLPRLYLGRELRSIETLGLVAAAFLLAVFSWKYVELPLRRWKRSEWPARTIGLGLGASLSLAGLAALFVLSGGAPWRYSEAVVLADRAQRYPSEPASCIRLDESQNHCAGKSFDILVWGDSHAGHYFPAVEPLARSMGLTAQLQSINGCPPLLGAEPVSLPKIMGHPARPRNRSKCALANAEVLKLVISEPRIRLVVLAGAWTFFGEGVDIASGERHFLATDASPNLSLARTRSIMRQSLRNTVRQLRAEGVQVLLLGQVPDNPISPSRCLADAHRRSEPATDCGRPAAVAWQRNRWSRSLLASVAVGEGAYLFSPYPILCGAERCAVTLGGHPLYRDQDHITAAGARLLGGHFPRAPFRAGAGEIRAENQPKAAPSV